MFTKMRSNTMAQQPHTDSKQVRNYNDISMLTWRQHHQNSNQFYPLFNDNHQSMGSLVSELIPQDFHKPVDASLEPVPIGDDNSSLCSDNMLLDFLAPIFLEKANQELELQNTNCHSVASPSTSESSISSNDSISSSDVSGDEFSQVPTASISAPAPLKFRSYQNDLWTERFQDLSNFQEKFGHCLVPHTYTQNASLIQWVKRQRHQFKLKKEGRHSTLTDERQHMLEGLGFVWDSHEAAWEERYNDLCEYRSIFGNCNVPACFTDNPQLSIWVKCQRRQFKLFWAGKKSHISRERISRLTDLGFVWNPRCRQRSLVVRR